MRYLIDSDVLIDALNGQTKVIELLDRLSDDGLAVSVVSLGDIYDGALGSTSPE